MVAAIDVYNKPDFAYRAESFTILALNARAGSSRSPWRGTERSRRLKSQIPV